MLGGVLSWFQERQSIIKYWLDNLRAKQGEVLHNIHFLEGQPISMFNYDSLTHMNYRIFLISRQTVMSPSSSRAGGPEGHPTNVPPARAEDPQPADDVLGPGCL